MQKSLAQRQECLQIGDESQLQQNEMCQRNRELIDEEERLERLEKMEEDEDNKYLLNREKK